MKDSEFIELLNLYLDHEISAADAVRLEAEVQSNPARRRIYQDYCRMQKACKVLAHDFQTEPVGADDKKVVPFSVATAGRTSRGNAFYTVGALAAAAACLAIIFVGRSRQQATDTQFTQAVAKSEATVAPVAKTVAIDTPQAQIRATRASAPLSIRRADQSAQATFVSTNALFLGANPSVAPATTTTQPVNDQFRWLTGELDLVSLDQQMGFQVPAMTVQSEGQQLGTNRATKKQQEPASEMVTFKYTLGR